MSQFDQLYKIETAQLAAAPQGTGIGGSVNQAQREPNVKERVLQHEQRIVQLESDVRDLRNGLEKLAGLLVDQFGLVIS